MNARLDSSQRIEDKLDRMNTIISLTQGLISEDYKDGFVIGIDSGWGKGKTTFLKLWEQYLKDPKEYKHKEEYNIISFNAWENDTSDNPLLSLMLQLKPFFLEKDSRNTIEAFSKIAMKGFRLSPYMKNMVEDINDIVEKHTVSIFAEEEERIKLTEKFKHALEQISSDKKLIFFIDELDRCRPNYAIELLESIKHLFNVKNCIFIIAWDKSQVSHAIKTVYGHGMDSTAYLKRFIGIDYKLPDPSRTVYAQAIIPKDEARYYSYFYDLLPTVIEIHELTLRDIDKLVMYLNINLNIITLKTDLTEVEKFYYSLLKGIFLVLRFKNPELYFKLLKSDGITAADLDDLKIQEIQTQAKFIFKENIFWVLHSAYDISTGSYSYNELYESLSQSQTLPMAPHVTTNDKVDYLFYILVEDFQYNYRENGYNVYECDEETPDDQKDLKIEPLARELSIKNILKDTNDIFSKIDFWDNITK